MLREILRTIAIGSFVLMVLLGAACQVQAQDAKTRYPNMAPVEQNVFCNPLETEA